jgi:KUP system potassium uptake protein
MLIWFAVLGIGGLIHIADDPAIFRAINPWYGVNFVATNGLSGLWALGFVFLAVTGAEALYADLGHFGRRPIQTAWLGLVLPCLVLNYVGQGALVLSAPETIKDPFYLLYPGWALIPVLGLATLATIIASQAVITGTFSLTRQAIQLNLLPRFRIAHTSESMPGQIYIPRVNIILAVAVIFVVLMFESSSNLAAAYGVAVTADMMISSLLLFFVLWRLWGWPVWRAALIIVPISLIEQVFFGANVAKLFDGAWLPIVIAAIVVFLMITWRRGANLLAAVTRRSETDFLGLAQNLDDNPPHRVPGTAVLFTADPETAPMALMHNLKHNDVLHERNIVLTIVTEEEPRVPRYERVQIEPINDIFTRVIASYGFMETPNVPKILEHCRQKGLEIDIDETSFFLSRRMLTPAGRSDMPRWQKRIFGWLTRTAENAMTYYHIPPDRVIEIGTRVTL